MKKSLALKITALLMAIIISLDISPSSGASADSTDPFIVYGDPVLNSVKGTFSFPDAEFVADDLSAVSVAVNVTAGYIASTGFTSADVLTQHRSATWKFASPKSVEEVNTFIRGLEFGFDDGMEVTITVDANPSSTLPAGATITTFTKHSDGKTHYYMFVSGVVKWTQAYNYAKGYTYMGLKGYLATITQIEEDIIIDNLTPNGAWAGGARIANSLLSSLDSDTSASHRPASSGAEQSSWVWACGPEAGTLIKARTDSPNASPAIGHNVNFASSGYSNWSSIQPDGYYSSSSNVGEWNMQVHFKSGSGEHVSEGVLNGWNDLPEQHELAQGYIVEFSEYEGGTVAGYSSKGTVSEVVVLGYDRDYTITVIGDEIVTKYKKTSPFANEEPTSEEYRTSIDITDGPNGSGSVKPSGLDDWGGSDLETPAITYESVSDDNPVPTTVKPTAPGEYKVTMTVTDPEGNTYTVSRLFTIDEDNNIIGGPAEEDALPEDTEPSYINRSAGYILYDDQLHRDDVIHYATDSDGETVATTYINMTKEQLVTDIDVVAYSVNGTAWKKCDLATINSQLSKLLANQTKLKLATSYNEKTKKGEGTILSFGTIKRRNATTKFTVNYYLCRDDYGLTNGQWCLTNKERGVNLNSYEIGICDDGKTIGAKGYGVWPCEGVWPECGGVWISSLPETSKKTVKEVYLYRKTAEENTPSSKPVKITVTSVLAAPKIKVDYKKESLKLKSGMSIYFGAVLPVYESGKTLSIPKLSDEATTYSQYAGHALLNITQNRAKKAIDVSGYITETRNTILIWQSPTSKKACTVLQTIVLAARHPAPTDPSEVITIKNGTAKLNKGYELYNPSTHKWTTTVPKATKDVDIIVRFKCNAKGGAENDTTYASGLTSTFRLTYGVTDEKTKRKGYTAVTLVQ